MSSFLRFETINDSPQAISAQALESVTIAGLDNPDCVEGKALNPGAQGLVTRGRPALVIGWALAKDVGLVPWCPRPGDLDGLCRHRAQGECVRVQGIELLAGLFEAVAGQLAEALGQAKYQGLDVVVGRGRDGTAACLVSEFSEAD